MAELEHGVMELAPELNGGLGVVVGAGEHGIGPEPGSGHVLLHTISYMCGSQAYPKPNAYLNPDGGGTIFILPTCIVIAGERE